MIRSEKAVSEVIGMVLILGIMILVIGIIMLAAVPMIESGKERARMDVAANSFLSMQNDIEEVVRGPIWITDPSTETNINRLGPSRETQFELMGGTLNVLPNSTNISEKSKTLNITTNKNFTIIIPPSSITYRADQERIVYENGAVFRLYASGMPIMVSNPLISIYQIDNNNITISIHAISLNGTLSSVGGDGKAWIETRLVKYNESIPPNSTIPNANNIFINITSAYPDAWESFFDEKLNKSAGLARTDKNSTTGYSINGTKPMEVRIFGKKSNVPDIYLSLYESRLDVKVR
ncbi:hypothetical protein METP3_00129 [Methanosarcinales archaeon]|nr:hypothetical protein METP3_00129 [Methanosarcinales archaeon]